MFLTLTAGCSTRASGEVCWGDQVQHWQDQVFREWERRISREDNWLSQPADTWQVVWRRETYHFLQNLNPKREPLSNSHSQWWTRQAVQAFQHSPGIQHEAPWNSRTTRNAKCFPASHSISSATITEHQSHAASDGSAPGDESFGGHEPAPSPHSTINATFQLQP